MLKTIHKFIGYFERRYHRHYREKKMHLIADFLLVVTILILVVFVISLKYGNFSYRNRLAVKVILSSEKIVSGGEELFEIKYSNTSKLNLLKTKFSFTLPEDFILLEVSPDNFFDKKTNSFGVGELIPGANGVIKIKGIVIGEIGEGGELTLNASYFSDDKFFNELFIKDYKIDLSGLELKWNNDGILYRGQPALMTLNLKNSSDIDLNNLEFNFINSDIYLSSEQINNNEVEIEDKLLKIKQIKPKTDLTIDFNLTYNGDDEAVELRLGGQALINNKSVKQVDLAQTFTVKESDLAIKINPEQSVIGINDEVIYKVILKNSGTNNIDNIVLNLSSTDARHLLGPIKIKNLPFVRLSGDQIVFNRKLSPNEEQEIELTAKFSRQEIKANDEISLKVAAKYNIGETKLKAYYFSNPVKIKTVYQFKAESRYFSAYGDQLGVGPIPPIAGIPTKYWVFWQFKNEGNKLSNLQISAELPSGVIWSDESSVNKGGLSFNQEKNVFVWQVDEVEGIEENCRLALALTIIPEANNVAKDILLLKNIKYNFFDSFTQENIAASTGNLTNNLSGDKYANNIDKIGSR